MAAINENIQDKMNATEANISLDPEPTVSNRRLAQMPLDHEYQSADSEYELRNRENIAKYGIYSAVGDVFCRQGASCYTPPGYGHKPRPSTISSKERKSRTAKKKNAKKSRKRNKKH